MRNELGRLESVELRGVWPNEAANFTPWLAEEENLSLLADTLNMELELEGREVRLGFGGRIDILCRNLENNSRVLIENQLEETDSDHLGRILEYMTGVDAATIVWIAENFREEHRAVFDRMNEMTEATFRFFGVEIELWRIGNSSPAPMFNIVSKPNDWQRSVSHATSGNLTETQLQQMQYWTELSERMSKEDCRIGTLNPGPNAHVLLAIGKGGISLKASVSTQKKRLSVRLVMFDKRATAYFNLLVQNREEIEQEFGESLEWNELPGKKSCHVSLHEGDTDPTSKADWAKQHAWFAKKLKIFDKVFRHRIQTLNAEDWQPEDEDDDE